MNNVTDVCIHKYMYCYGYTDVCKLIRVMLRMYKLIFRNNVTDTRITDTRIDTCVGYGYMYTYIRVMLRKLE